jgi:hypothetical protein
MKNIAFSKHSDRSLRIEDSFYPHYQKLRDSYEKRFQNPLHAHADRFCWDYWNVPEQYRLLRTPAQDFFGTTLFKPFLDHLLSWGRRNLGCQMISHPWLSAYVNDCYQDLHSDVPHGPWSFVFSMTPWKRKKFSGGETFIAQPKLLNYFREFDSAISDETPQLIQKITPQENRLVVFDPRYPHGVTRVNGVEDLLDARLVIHGWFTEPRPMIEGSLTTKKALSTMDQIAENLIESFSATDLSGIFCVRLTIQREGTIRMIEVLTSHLIHSSSGKIASTAVITQILNQSLLFRFPRSSGITHITLPIEIKA